jgi:hypothetical protein
MKKLLTFLAFFIALTSGLQVWFQWGTDVGWAYCIACSGWSIILIDRLFPSPVKPVEPV